MSRPVAVTASAVVAILGSTFTLLLAAGAIASLFFATAQPKPPNSAQFIIAGVATMVAFAGLGIWTSVGLFRLRSWARTSILVFAGFLVAWCAFILAITMVTPLPPDTSTATEHTIRRMMAVMFAIPLAIGVWWLIQFNTASTKSAFASSTAEPASLRPLSISIIGWVSIFGAASCLFGIALRMPAFLFGVLFTGWSAIVFYVLFGALSLYIGKGLLDLRERARIVAIAWFGFSVVHMAIVTLVPSLRQRMLDFQLSLSQSQDKAINFDPGMLNYVSLAGGAIVGGAAIWFLIRNRPAFARAENA